MSFHFYSLNIDYILIIPPSLLFYLYSKDDFLLNHSYLLTQVKKKCLLEWITKTTRLPKQKTVPYLTVPVIDIYKVTFKYIFHILL